MTSLLAGADMRLDLRLLVRERLVAGDSDEEVVVLVFLTQSTTSRSSPDPVVSGSRVEVTMRRVGSAWLVAGLDTR